MSSQLATGNVYWDSLSILTINLTNVSELTGAIINDESFNGGAVGSEGYCDLNIDNNSKFIVTGNCRLRNITNNSNSLIRDNNGKIVTIVNTNNTLIIEGNSDYVISIASYSGITEES
jgi:predicted component of type VI protein secretion system